MFILQQILINHLANHFSEEYPDETKAPAFRQSSEF
jgi:hypothetical protein